MTSPEAAGYFATLVGLICNWKGERGSASTDRFQDFMIYLTNHNFEALRSEIVNSTGLQNELRELLEKDSAMVSEKLDAVCQGLSSLSDKVAALSPLVRTLRAPTDELSQQAMEVLKVFEQSEATRMLTMRDGTHFGLMPTGGQFGPGEPRFILDDLAMLCGFGLLNLAEYNGAGDPIYTLTRTGVAIVKDLPPVKDPNGKLIGTR